MERTLNLLSSMSSFGKSKFSLQEKIEVRVNLRLYVHAL